MNSHILSHFLEKQKKNKKKTTNQPFLLKTVIRQADRRIDGQTGGIKELTLQELCVSYGFKNYFAYVYAYNLHFCKVLTDAEHLRKNFKIILILVINTIQLLFTQTKTQYVYDEMVPAFLSHLLETIASPSN